VVLAGRWLLGGLQQKPPARSALGRMIWCVRESDHQSSSPAVFAPPRKSSTSPTPSAILPTQPPTHTPRKLPLPHAACLVAYHSHFFTEPHTYPQIANMVVKVGSRAGNTGTKQQKKLTRDTGRYQRFRPHWSHRFPQRVCLSLLR
jgi:hypothetical protein